MLEEKECKNCGKIFTPKLKSQKFCCYDCRYHYTYNHNFVNVICTNCGKEFKRHKDGIKHNQNIYCSRKCELEHKHKEYNEIRHCEMCNTEFEVKKKSNQRFCSRRCQHKWQTTQVGKLNPRYADITTKCDYCGKQFHTHQYKLDTNRNNFCSVECRQKWYSEVWSQSQEWKDQSKINAVKMLENGVFNHTNTAPQIIVNNLLDSLNINYENEFNCKYFSIDNALHINDKLYFIEVMGTYWHCDRRKYTDIPYKMQYDRIIKDKAKNTYIKNNYNSDILYLWEEDIYNNIDMCKDLLLKYISKDNDLLYYNSSDYYFINNKLLINPNSVTQYMYIDNIGEHLNIDLKPKLSRKQEDKWITFKCEICGKEHEELISHYNKSKHHCCSYECANILQNTQMTLICPCCGKDFKMKICEYNRRVNKDKIFCSVNCRHKFNQVKFNCECCGKEILTTKAQYKKSKHHYCSSECFYTDQKKTNTTRQ